MRCADCNKFTPLDASNEPEADDAYVDNDGHVTGNVREQLANARAATDGAP